MIYAETQTDRQTNEQTKSLKTFQWKRKILRQFNVASNNKTYLGLHVTLLVFLPHFNKNLDFI
jgi:hypothetical protein